VRSRSYTDPMTADSTKDLARGAKDSPLLTALARLGFAMSGLVHVLIGLLAIGIVTGGGGTADQSGALAQLAEAPGGRVLLWGVVVGLGALGVWLLLGAFLFPARDPKKKVLHVAKEAGKGVAYLALAVTASGFALGGSSSSSGSTGAATASLLQAPAGRVLVGVLGLAVIAIGVYFVVKGVRQRFREDITVPPGRAGDATVAVGVTGYAAKGVVLGVVGILFVVAAVTVDASRATGLDGALTALAGLPFGVVLLWAIGIGLIAYGVYCGVRAAYARL
jgi:hypothetical protein